MSRAAPGPAFRRADDPADGGVPREAFLDELRQVEALERHLKWKDK